MLTCFLFRLLWDSELSRTESYFPNEVEEAGYVTYQPQARLVRKSTAATRLIKAMQKIIHLPWSFLLILFS